MLDGAVVAEVVQHVPHVRQLVLEALDLRPHLEEDRWHHVLMISEERSLQKNVRCMIALIFVSNLRFCVCVCHFELFLED